MSNVSKVNDVNKGNINNYNINKMLQVSEYEDKIFMPNEIFADLRSVIDSGKHMAFAYSYYYLLLWLYRYAKYGSVNVDVKMVKSVLGVSINNKTVDYIIKKDGILDQLGYTYSSTDYPFAWEFNDGDILFGMVSELDAEAKKYIHGQRGKNYKIKVPIKGIYRSVESEKDNYEDGVFYDVSDTHSVRWDIFTVCVESGLGCVGFYIYGYLKRQCDIHGEYNSSYNKLGEELGLNKDTVIKYIRGLSDVGIVDIKENGCKKIDGNFKKEANTYTVVR